MQILTLLPPLWVIGAVFVIVTAAAIVQAGLGMGFGIMSAPLLALFAPDMVPVPTLWIGLAMSAWTAALERPGIVWSEVGFGSVGRLAGVVLGIWLIALTADRVEFSLVFGGMIGLGVLLTLSGRRLRFNRPNFLGMATLSGMMGTITSVGAPPMALIYHSRPSQEARPTLAAFFAIGCALSLGGLYLWGLGSLRDLLLAGLLVPPMLLGMLLARRMRARFDSRYKALLLAIAGGASVLLIIRGLG